MNLLQSAAALVIAVTTVLTFYTALLHLTRPYINNMHRFRIVRDVIVGTQALQLYFITRDLHQTYPFLLYPFITLLFVTGALYYIRYYMFLYPGGKLPTLARAQLAPALIIFAWETWFYFSDFARSQAEIRGVFNAPTQHLITYLIAAGVVILLVQHGMLLKLELDFFNNEKVKVPIRVSSVLTGFYMVDQVLIAAGFIMARPPILHAGVLLLGLTGITYLLFENRYPRFYQLIAQEERQKKYRRSAIQGLSRDKIMARLQELMEEEKIYRQLEIKLDDVAAMLFITPHQLSEFVNDCMDVNFATYLNRYRVQEAKELLIQQPDRSTLSICFDVGFGSKQSFNTLFKQQTGMTPSEYRKRHAASANPANSGAEKV